MLTMYLATGIVGAGDTPTPTPSPTPALTLDFLKQYLRYEAEDTEQDAVLFAGLNAAINHVERHTGLLLTRREVMQPVRSFGSCIPALWGPRPEIVAITYTGSDGAPGIVSDARVVNTDSLGRGSFYPSFAGQWPWGQDIVLAYEAGFANPEDVPPALLMAVLLMAGNFDANRSGVVTGTITSELPLAVASLIDSYRMVGV